ncbi:MAG: hypothetical protein SOV35_01265 [Clostridium sp.]|nr:hypothetical protein [Clostridium sp.]
MSKIIKISPLDKLFRLIIISKEGKVLYDKYLSKNHLSEKLKELSSTYKDTSFHIKVCRNNKIIVNRLFFPFSNNEKAIMERVQ